MLTEGAKGSCSNYCNDNILYLQLNLPLASQFIQRGKSCSTQPKTSTKHLGILLFF